MNSKPKSKLKGKRAELAFAAVLRDHGFEARRGVQFAGSLESPDVVSNLPFHIEVKNCERVKLRNWVAQAEGDARGKAWVLAHRWNGGQWLITLRAEDFLPLVQESLPPSTPLTSISTLPPASCEADNSAEPHDQNKTEPKGQNMKLNDLYPSRWLKAADVTKPVVVTIKNIAVEEVSEGEDKPVLHFAGDIKPMVLNRTNSATLGELYGEDTDMWSGKSVVLFSTKVQFQSKLVDAIRIRAPKTKTATTPAPAVESGDDVPF